MDTHETAPVSPDAEATAEALVALLTERGAERVRHAGGRSLLDHLLGCRDIVRRWGQPEWLARAALLHSVYGSESLPVRLFSPSDRDPLRAVAGERAERLAYLFSVTPRAPLLAGTHRWARGLTSEPGEPPLSAADHDALLVLHMVNLAEQTRAADGGPGHWLTWTGRLSELLEDSSTITLPAPVSALAQMTSPRESQGRGAYRSGVQRGDDPAGRASRLALAAELCPAVAEPCVWLAVLARAHGDLIEGRAWASAASERLAGLGAAWDKRLSYEMWGEVADAPAEDRIAADSLARVTDPRALYRAVVEGARPATAARGGKSPTAEEGRRRFHRYVESLADAPPPVLGLVYPGLAAQAWHEPADIPLAIDLSEHFDQVREEILSLEPARFHRESEPIRRSGEWDVAFLYERGRRRDAVCDACPVTTEIVERHRTVRTTSGLVYASRMRPGTHVAAHRGPTNLRLRCHLAIAIPEGDCAIRVGGETRRWREGGCLVFDDFLEHEAWNRTDADRIVLIVDVWHPGLSDTEVALLEGLQRYALWQAGTLSRYWAANARSAGETPAR